MNILEISSPWAVTVSWQRTTYKPIKTRSDWSSFWLAIIVHQLVCACSITSLDMLQLRFVSAWLTHRHTDGQLMTGYTIISASWAENVPDILLWQCNTENLVPWNCWSSFCVRMSGKYYINIIWALMYGDLPPTALTVSDGRQRWHLACT